MPPSLSTLSVPLSGWERREDWTAEPACLPLYAPLKSVLSAPPEEILRLKHEAWEHCSRHFSLAAQAALLEDFFRARIAGRA
jgi:hypothetical protein